MTKTTPFPSRRVWLALVLASACLSFESPSSVACFSLRARETPNSTVEDSVTFPDEEGPSGRALEVSKDVEIKPHSQQAAETAAGSEAEASQREESEGEEEESSVSVGEGGSPSQAGGEQAEEEGASEQEQGPSPSGSTVAERGGAPTTTRRGGPPIFAPRSVAEPTAESSRETKVEAETDEEREVAPRKGGAGGPTPPPHARATAGEAAGAGDHPHGMQEKARFVGEEEMKQTFEEAPPPKEEERPLKIQDLNARLKALGAPFTLGKQHFTVDFKHGFKLEASDYERLAAEGQGVLWRAVAREPLIKSERTLFLTIDIDDPFIGTDARLVQLLVRPQACTVEAENACKVQWYLQEPSPASPPHRILLLGFASPTGAKVQFDDLFKRMQQHPTDVDLRRISLPKFFESFSYFFNDDSGHFAASPSWHAFALASHAVGEDGTQLDHPLTQLPAGATAAEREEARLGARSSGEEIDRLSTPQHGGESPGAGGSSVDASSIFKYLLVSLLLVGLLVGVALTVCNCAKSR